MRTTDIDRHDRHRREWCSHDTARAYPQPSVHSTGKYVRYFWKTIVAPARADADSMMASCLKTAGACTNIPEIVMGIWPAPAQTLMCARFAGHLSSTGDFGDE